MIYSFEGQLISEGNRSFIDIPFHVWEEAGRKGNLPASVTVNDCVFECKPVPKGKGRDYIPIHKAFVGALGGRSDVAFAGKLPPERWKTVLQHPIRERSK